MSEENEKVIQDKPQSADNNPSPFAKMNPAEIPLDLQFFAYKGNKETSSADKK